MTDRGPFIALCSGRRWYLDDPRQEDVSVDDIAIGIAHINRFTGQARAYSVATHSCHVADIAIMLGYPELELEGLVHDAHEFAVGDVSSPLKAMLPDYRRIEAKNASAVRAYFGVPPGTSHVVKRADAMATHDEGRVFCPDSYWTGPFSGLRLTTEEPVEAMERWGERVRRAMRRSGLPVAQEVSRG